MIWDKDISFEGFTEKINNWYADKDIVLGDPPIEAQYALDLIFKTLIDDKENYPYLTTIPESAKQTNSIMLDLILRKYSRKYRRYLKKDKRRYKAMTRYIDENKIKFTCLTFEDADKNVYVSLSNVRQAIAQTPTADVREVKRGKWEDVVEYDDTCIATCSSCRQRIAQRESNTIRFKLENEFCRKCGADMRGDVK